MRCSRFLIAPETTDRLRRRPASAEYRRAIMLLRRLQDARRGRAVATKSQIVPNALRPTKGRRRTEGPDGGPASPSATGGRHLRTATTAAIVP